MWTEETKWRGEEDADPRISGDPIWPLEYCRVSKANITFVRLIGFFQTESLGTLETNEGRIEFVWVYVRWEKCKGSEEYEAELVAKEKRIRLTEMAPVFRVRKLVQEIGQEQV